MDQLEVTEKEKKKIKSLKDVKSVFRRISESPPKSRFKLILKILFAIISISGLLIQTTTLVIKYLDRNTVVNIDVGFINYDTIPGITVCYEYFLSMERTAQKFPQLNTTYEDYQTLVNNLTVKDMNEALLDNLTNIFENDFRQFVEKQNLTVSELFDLSIPLERNSIHIEVDGSKQFKAENDTFDDHVYGYTPIESVVFPLSKCFTFFSHINKDNRDLMMFIEHIQIQVKFSSKWFPPSKSSKIWLAIHSPNAIPNELTIADFNELDFGKNYVMTFNEKNTRLLEPPYRTNCRKYDQDHPSIKFWSDCVNRCIVDTLRQYSYNPKDCLFRTSLILRNYSFEGEIERKMKLCPWPKIHALENLKCKIKCEADCDNRFYNFDIKSEEIKSSLSEMNSLPYILVDIKHNGFPDEIITHSPEMTFTSLSASFGGLLGLWMGLSTLAVLNLFTQIW